jgi:hypothetical protein
MENVSVEIRNSDLRIWGYLAENIADTDRRHFYFFIMAYAFRQQLQFPATCPYYYPAICYTDVTRFTGKHVDIGLNTFI